MLINILRWFRGYVLFKINNKSEKFVNKILKNNIILWDFKKNNNNFHAKTSILEYKTLKKISQKTDPKTKIIKKYGWPFFVLKYQKRAGLLVGIVLFCTILWVLSLFIWKIDIYGNENISNQEIMCVLKNLNIHTGIFKNNINSYLIKQNIMSKINNISWISVNIQGSHMKILIKEKIKTPEIVNNYNTPCDIISNSEGQICRIETYSGTPLVNIDDAVTENQILISSIVQNENNINLVHADGNIYAKTKHIINQKIKLHQLNSKNTDKIVKIYKINLFNKEFIFNFWDKNKIDEQYKITKINKKINIFDIELPICLNQDVCCFQECEEKILSEEEAQNINIKNILKQEKIKFKNKKIISRQLESYLENNEEYVTKITITCIENISKKQVHNT